LAAGGETTTNGVLAGLVVVETGERVGCGVCGALLAQLGATVVLVEAAPAAGQVAAAAAKGTYRDQLAPGKLSVRADPTREEDRRLLRDLLAAADVIVRASDLDAQALAPAGPAHSHQIVCDITAFGRTGPMAGQAWTELQMQALTGVVDTTGLPGGAPTPVPLPVVEYLTGVYAAAATVAALRVRRLSGVGQQIDMALFDCAFAAISTFLQRILDGTRSQVSRMGNRHSMAVPWNVYRATDGWILLCAGSDEQWMRLAAVMGAPELGRDPRYLHLPERVACVAEIDERVQAWVGTQSVEGCVAQLTAASVACGPITPIDGHPREANLDHRRMIGEVIESGTGRRYAAPASPLRMSVTPGRLSERLSRADEDRGAVEALLRTILPGAGGRASGAAGQPAPPLAGVRVIEVGHYTTAPLAARLLASLGAEVIKVEPPGGEAVRDWPPVRNGMGYFFAYANSDKKSLVLDLSTEVGLEALRRLIAKSHVLVENLRPGTMAKRGLPPEEVLRINPRMVLCSLSGFGADSAYHGRPAFDTVIQAMSGIMDLIRVGEVPVKSGISTADLLGGEFGVLAILAALEHADRTGQGQYIDLAMQDIAAWATQCAWNGASRPPACVVRAADGDLVIEAAPERVLQVLPDGRRGPETGVLQAAASRAELLQSLEEAGLIAQAVLGVRDTVDLPQVEARRLWFEAKAPGGEVWPLLASPLRLCATPPVVRQPMAPLGRDNEEILRSLGLA